VSRATSRVWSCRAVARDKQSLGLKSSRARQAESGVAEQSRATGSVACDFVCRMRQAESGVEEQSRATCSVVGDFECRMRQAESGVEEQSRATCSVVGDFECRMRQAESGVEEQSRATCSVVGDFECRMRQAESGVGELLESCCSQAEVSPPPGKQISLIIIDVVLAVTYFLRQGGSGKKTHLSYQPWYIHGWSKQFLNTTTSSALVNHQYRSSSNLPEN
jgi:hypothetical protein